MQPRRRDFLLSSFVATPLAAQAPVLEERNKDIFKDIFRVDTFNVTAPVTVLDNDGKLVNGLESKDFTLFDNNAQSAESLAARLRQHYPNMEVRTGSNDPSGHDLVINATPLGMKDGDPLPVDVARLSPNTFVGEVVMKQEITPLLRAAQEKGCRTQVGTDMLYEQIPAYLEFFGFPTTTPEELRAVSKVAY